MVAQGLEGSLTLTYQTIANQLLMSYQQLYWRIYNLVPPNSILKIRQGSDQIEFFKIQEKEKALKGPHETLQSNLSF
jgi:hypothetical protein